MTQSIVYIGERKYLILIKDSINNNKNNTVTKAYNNRLSDVNIENSMNHILRNSIILQAVGRVSSIPI